MRNRLCFHCIKRLAGSTSPGHLETILNQIADRTLEVCWHYPDCDNWNEPGHPKPARYILEELPPSAKA